MPKDIYIECKDCGKNFLFSIDEQEYFKDMDFEQPKRCPACRKRKKAKSQERELFQYYGGYDF